MNKKGFWILMAIVLAGGVLGGVLLLRSSAKVAIGNTVVTVAVADTEALREKGLSGHAPFPDTEGMLFVFDAPNRPAFWMKDMQFPLDIIWISSDWHIVDISKSLTPETYPAAFSPSADVQYVLEVPAGFSDRHSVQIGQSVSFRK